MISELTTMNSFVDQKLGFPVYDAAMFVNNPDQIKIKESNKKEEPIRQQSIISVESESETIYMEVEKEFQKYHAVEISRQENNEKQIVLQPAKFIAPETIRSRVANFSRVNQLYSDSDSESELQPLPPSPPPGQTDNSNPIPENDLKDIAGTASKNSPKISQNLKMAKESTKKEPIIEGRSISSDDGFDPTSARKKIPAMDGPIQKSAQPFGVNRSPKKPINHSSGRGRPMERPRGGLKSLTASSQAQKQRLKRTKVHTKISRAKNEKENTKPLARGRTPSPKRM